jgi:hypothetical protein
MDPSRAGRQRDTVNRVGDDDGTFPTAHHQPLQSAFVVLSAQPL